MSITNEKENISLWKNKVILLLLGIFITIILTILASKCYNSNISKNVQDISSIYLEEISQREISHLENNLRTHFNTMRLSESIFRDMLDISLSKMQEYLGKMQTNQNYDFFAMIDEDGNYCSPNEYKPAIGKIRSLHQLLDEKKHLISFDVSISNQDILLLGLPIDPLMIGGKRFVAITIGIRTDEFIQKAALMGTQNQTRTSIITSDGSLVVDSTQKNDTPMGTNLFSILEQNAVMDSGFSLNTMKHDMLDQKKGMSAYTLNRIHTLLYYAPVTGTNWYIVSEMPYSVIQSTVQDLLRLTTFIGAAIVIIIVSFIIIFLLSVSRVNTAKQRTADIKQTLEQTDLAKQQAEEALLQIAFYDDLTKISNKNLFRKSAKELLNPESRYAYVILDIRKFKVINDLFGYSCGDQLLKCIAHILQAEMKQGELSSRFTDDIFHLLLFYQNKYEIEGRLMQIADQICEFPFAAESTFHIIVEFGIYVIDNVDESIEQMGDKAGLALKNIKEQHTTGVFFYNDDIRNTIMEEQGIENDMQLGIDQEEFIIYFQPKYAAHSETLSGAEALVRWQHPKRGLIPPDLFIPIFEKNGFILSLDLYVLEATCKILRQWLDQGLDVKPVSINQSRLLLYSAGYMDTLIDVTEKYEIPHHLIDLEVTESVFLEDSHRMISVMQQLHLMNFTFSMDDFGSGYSTLNMLKEIMVDTLKIDKDFFSESSITERGRKIVSDIIQMAHHLDIKVVAEGVETQEQAEFLIESSCDTLQGYYYSRPIPKDEYESLILPSHS